MRCCVLLCVNNGSSRAPPADVTFYKIPKDHHLKNVWTEAIGTPEWQLKPNSKVCSAHFEPHDFTVLETGEKVLAEGAVPHLNLDLHRDLHTAADFITCRVCLSMDRRMYHIRDCDLHHAYEMTVGVKVEIADRLPQMLCWECTSRLLSFKKFKQKAQMAQLLLLDKLSANNILTVGDIKSINRLTYDLKSHLTMEYSEFGVPEDRQQLDEKQTTDTVTSNLGLTLEVNGIFGCTVPKCNVVTEPTILVENILNSDEDDEMNCGNVSLAESDHLDVRKTTKVRKQAGKRKVRNMTRKKTIKDEKEKENTSKLYLDFDVRHLTLEEQVAAHRARAQSAAYLAAPHKCDLCYKGFLSAATLALHAVRHTDKCGLFECEICKRRFLVKGDVRDHLKSHAEEYSCKACQFLTNNRESAVDHQKWHAGKTYTCPHCPTTLTKFTSYLSHLRLKHASRFACELCGYTFLSERGVEMHKRKSHVLDVQMKLSGPYCEECKLRFASDDAYQRHLTQSSVHSNDNDPRRVRNERKPYTTASRRHTSAAARAKEVVTCDQCGERQSGYREYAKHFRTAHPDLIRTKFKGNCMCEQCGRIFPCQTFLKEHMAWHANDRLYKCQVCDKAFTTKVSLWKHKFVHDAQAPRHRCPHCERQFLLPKNLARHVSTVHKGEKLFPCDICGKELTTANGRRAHVDHVHHKIPWPKRVRVRATSKRVRSPPAANADD